MSIGLDLRWLQDFDEAYLNSGLQIEVRLWCKLRHELHDANAIQHIAIFFGNAINLDSDSLLRVTMQQ